MAIEFIDREISHDDTTVGNYGLDDSGRIVAVVWKILFRKHNSFAFSASLLESIDSEKIYVVDKEGKSVYLFKKSDYIEGEMVKEGGDYQYVLDRENHLKKWSSLDEILK